MRPIAGNVLLTSLVPVLPRSWAWKVTSAHLRIARVKSRSVVLYPFMNIQEAIAVFDGAEAESLAVVEDGNERRAIGILTEAHAMRRYAEESEQRRREAVGEI